MSESMAARVGRIISGGLNALIDSVENAAPESVMEQAIREIDAAVDEVRAELGKVIANKHLANQRLETEREKHHQLEGQIAVALGEGRDDLAEAGIARQLDIEAQLPVLEKSIAELSEREKELEGYIEALKAKKREMGDELEQFRFSRETTQAAGPEASAPTGAKVNQASAAFERVMERSTGVGSGANTDPKDAVRLAELEELSRRNRIRERLEALKATSK